MPADRCNASPGGRGPDSASAAAFSRADAPEDFGEVARFGCVVLGVNQSPPVSNPVPRDRDFRDSTLSRNSTNICASGAHLDNASNARLEEGGRSTGGKRVIPVSAGLPRSYRVHPLWQEPRVDSRACCPKEFFQDRLHSSPLSLPLRSTPELPRRGFPQDSPPIALATRPMRFNRRDRK